MKTRAPYKRIHQGLVYSANPLAPGPITPNLTKEERKARWAERMPWPDDYSAQPRSRQTALAEVVRLWS